MNLFRCFLIICIFWIFFVIGLLLLTNLEHGIKPAPHKPAVTGPRLSLALKGNLVFQIQELRRELAARDSIIITMFNIWLDGRATPAQKAKAKAMSHGILARPIPDMADTVYWKQFVQPVHRSREMSAQEEKEKP